MLLWLHRICEQEQNCLQVSQTYDIDTPPGLSVVGVRVIRGTEIVYIRKRMNEIICFHSYCNPYTWVVIQYL